jgi:hypothetical protein
LPVAFVGALLGIKSAVEGTSNFKPQIIEAYLPEESDVFTPMSFTDYVTALQAKRQCVQRSSSSDTYADNFGESYFDITGMPYQATDWQVPMLKCDADKCRQQGEDAGDYCEFMIVALAAEDEAGLQRALEMKEYMLQRYPVLANPKDNDDINVDFDLVQLFNSSDAMDAYVQRSDYGNADVPKIAMGIVWDTGNDATNYRYKLRQNSTNFNNPTQDFLPAVRTTPDTTKRFDSYAKTDAGCVVADDGAAYQGIYGDSCTGLYLYNGVLTFQRLVGDFILHDTSAAAAGYMVADAGVSYVKFPSPQYEEEGFYEAISGKFVCLFVSLCLCFA